MNKAQVVSIKHFKTGHTYTPRDQVFGYLLAIFC